MLSDKAVIKLYFKKKKHTKEEQVNNLISLEAWGENLV